jgi:hypothetical protein
MNPVEVLVAFASGGGATWLGNGLLTWFRDRDGRHATDLGHEVKLEEHRDKLTFDLLSAARVEVASARDEVAALRPTVARLAMREAHLDEALDQIDGLLNSDTAEEMKAARRRARAFVNRMRRLADANGTIRNEAQVAISSASVEERKGED